MVALMRSVELLVTRKDFLVDIVYEMLFHHLTGGELFTEVGLGAAAGDAETLVVGKDY